MSMNSAPKGSAQEEMERFAEEQKKRQAKERTAKKKAESLNVAHKNFAENISALSKKTRDDYEAIFEGVPPVNEKMGEPVVSIEDIQKSAPAPKIADEQPPAEFRKKSARKPPKEHVVSNDQPPAPFRKKGGGSRKIEQLKEVEPDTINEQEYLSAAEETGKKVAEMVRQRKEREAAEKEQEEPILNTYFETQTKFEASKKRRDDILKKIEQSADEDSKKELRKDLIDTDTEVKSYGLKMNDLISKMSPEEKVRIEAEKKFDAEANSMLAALKEAGLMEEEEKLAKKAEELERRVGEKLKKREEEKNMLKNKIYEDSKESVVEKKIDDLIKHNEVLEKEFNSLYKKFKKMENSSLFSWDRIKYIMSGEQDADKNELIGMIDLMGDNDKEIRELGKDTKNEKIKEYIDDRPKKIREMMEKMK